MSNIEQERDRKEVRHIMHDIEAYANEVAIRELESLLSKWNKDRLLGTVQARVNTQESINRLRDGKEKGNLPQ